MKRIFDLSLACLALVLMFPVLLVVALLVRFKLGSPVLFSQMRPGMGGVPFRIYKFRTMTSQCGSDGVLLSDRDRLTSFGGFLRSSSLDEVPALWNVLKGDMSLVGPRPLLMEYLSLYSDEEARRHNMRPGITGWAQVNGRNAISWSDKFKLDVWYVDNQNLRLDLKIILLTIKKVFVREGISAQGEATMKKFTGHI